MFVGSLGYSWITRLEILVYTSLRTDVVDDASCLSRKEMLKSIEPGIRAGYDDSIREIIRNQEIVEGTVCLRKLRKLERAG